MIGQFGSFEFALASRYRLEEVIGRGAMGVVYRATDVRIGRPIAIKMLHPILTTEIGIRRFQSEITIAGNLQHPAIVPVFDSGEVDGHLYYVMPYLAGESLRTRLDRHGALTTSDALSVMSQIAAGLQHAHDHGVVHRDVKPENILLSEGRASLTDFGLARMIDASISARLTQSGFIVGSPYYLSPEQAAGEKQITPMADQYALACVLFEMLTAGPPFTGDSATVIAMRHANEEPPTVKTLRPHVPDRLDAAVSRAMRKKAEDRFASVQDFAGAAIGVPDGGAAVAPIDGSSFLSALKARWSAVVGRR